MFRILLLATLMLVGPLAMAQEPSGILAQGSKRPWRVHQNYALDMMALRFGSLEDGAMVFSRPEPAAVQRDMAA